MSENHYKLKCNEDGLVRVQHWVSEGEFLDLAAVVAKRRLERVDKTPLESPRAVGNYIKRIIGHLEREVFGCLYLNTKHCVIRYDEDLFRGTIDGAVVHPRVVVKEALKVNAAAIVITHQHPSGIPEPSQADIALTRRVRNACDLVDVRLLDHLIVGGEEVTSLSARGEI